MEIKQSQNERVHKKSEVYPYEIGDAKKMISYFESKEMWLHYMLFVLSLNLARRIGDMLALRWSDFFDPNTGKFRQNIEIREDKTDKLANPRINSSCRAAINFYIEKTGCDVSLDNYSVPVFMQLTGNYKGRVLTASGYLKSLKKIASAVGIEHNVGSHSTRKTFGMMSRRLHPGDCCSMELLQTIYNHRDTKTTNRYIGLTKEKIDAYYDDMGNFFDEYILGDKEYHDISDKPIVSLCTEDLRNIIRAAYESGKNNADSTDGMVHVDAISDLMKMVEEVAK